MAVGKPGHNQYTIQIYHKSDTRHLVHRLLVRPPVYISLACPLVYSNVEIWKDYSQ